MVTFNNKYKPKTKQGKQKNWNTSDSVDTLYEEN